MNSYTSIYIPRVSTVHNEESVKHIMSYYYVGTVSYVDFTPINKKPGFGENVDDIVKSAFVHFSDPVLCDDEQYHYLSDITLSNNEFWHIINMNQPYKLQVSQNEYWLCLKNKNPVKRTLMNIHQVVESGRHVENLVEEQAKKIEELENKITNINNVVYQLIGKLFCQNSQRENLEYYLSILDCKGDKETAQYEHCMYKINQLEKMFKNIIENEEQDTALLARKHSDKYIDDNSSICSEYADEMDIEISEEDEERVMERKMRNHRI